MKYAIQVSLCMYDPINKREYEQWNYVAIIGKFKLFAFEDAITENTKLFDTVEEAEAYRDKYFGSDKVGMQYNEVRIVEVIK